MRRPRRDCAAALLALLVLGATPVAAPDGFGRDAGPCRTLIGPHAAAALVARCAAVSPTPLPFCGPNASCAEIEAEIARGCDLLDDEAPPFCVAYRDR